MKAIILAAGFATRLYPLTENQAKPLLPIGNKPMIEHILQKIEQLPVVDRIIIVTNDKFYKDFLAWQERYQVRQTKNKIKKPITIVNDLATHNQGRLGALGDIFFAIRSQSLNDDLLVIAGDNLFGCDLAKVHHLFQVKEHAVVAVHDLRKRELLAKKLGVVELDYDNRIVGFEEKPEIPKTSLAATGIYFFPKSLLTFMVRTALSKKIDNPGDLIVQLLKEELVYAYVFTEYWYDIGTKEQYERLKNTIL